MLYLFLYVLGDDALISISRKWIIYVLIHNCIKGEVGAVKPVEALQ